MHKHVLAGKSVLQVYSQGFISPKSDYCEGDYNFFRYTGVIYTGDLLTRNGLASAYIDFNTEHDFYRVRASHRYELERQLHRIKSIFDIVPDFLYLI